MESPYFFLDVLYAHPPPSPANMCQVSHHKGGGGEREGGRERREEGGEREEREERRGRREERGREREGCREGVMFQSHINYDY